MSLECLEQLDILAKNWDEGGEKWAFYFFYSLELVLQKMALTSVWHSFH